MRNNLRILRPSNLKTSEIESLVHFGASINRRYKTKAIKTIITQALRDLRLEARLPFEEVSFLFPKGSVCPSSTPTFLFASRGQSQNLQSDKTNRVYFTKLRQLSASLQIMRSPNSICSELEIQNWELSIELKLIKLFLFQIDRGSCAFSFKRFFKTAYRY